MISSIVLLRISYVIPSVIMNLDVEVEAVAWGVGCGYGSGVAGLRGGLSGSNGTEFRSSVSD